MARINVYLENGFEHDRVVVAAGDDEVEEPDATTRHQVGLARVVELTVADDEPAVVRVEVPDRGIVTTTTVDPAAAGHLRVDLTDGTLTVATSPHPPMFA